MSKDFLISLKYQNNLPSAPSGPFFKKVDMFHSLEKIGEYRMSTLEKNYVWQPHFGSDVGLNLDLVDQEAMLIQDGAKQVPDQAELKYLNGNVDKGRGKLKQIDQASKPWWLRNTTYMENNLFNAVINKNHDTESTLKHNEAKRKQMGDTHDPFAEDFIENSFKLLDKTISGLKSKSKCTVLWEMPLLPLDLPEHLQTENDRSYSLVRFDEDPFSNSKSDTVDNLQSSSSAAKRRRINAAVATNFRQSQNADNIIKSTAALEVSLVAPSAASDDASQQDGDSSRSGSGSGEKLFTWVRDYRMDVADSKVDDCFLMLVDDSSYNNNHSSNNSSASNGSGSAVPAARYFAVRSRVDMKKLSAEESRPCDCLVTSLSAAVEDEESTHNDNNSTDSV